MSTELTPIERGRGVLQFDETKARLVDLAARSARIVEITGAPGYKEAHQARIDLKNARVDIQKRGKDARADATAFSKAVIAAEGELVEVIEPEESRLQRLQDAWDAAREAERKAKIRAEQDRVAAIQKRINDIRTSTAVLIGPSSEALRIALADLREMTIGDVFAEFAPAAESAKAEAIAATEGMIAAAEQREAAEAQRQQEETARVEALRIESEKLAAERAELHRLRAELRAQQEAAAKTQAEAEAAQEAQRRIEEDARQAEEERKRAAEWAILQAAQEQAREDRKTAGTAEAARIAAEIANATLREAAKEAVGLLTELGEGENIVTRKLAAALAREGGE